MATVYMAGQPAPAQDTDNPQFWEMCYQSGNTPWEYGTHAPPLETFMQSPYKMSPGRFGVLGCGTGYDALFLAQCGYEVVGIDFAPSAINATHQKFLQAGYAGKSAYLLQRNIFDMYEYRGYFDYLFEHTTFCSINPADRKRYMFATRDLLKPGGKFLALWWMGDRKGQGIPYSVDKNELFDLYDGIFSFDFVFEPQNSFPRDQGAELLTLMTRL